MIISLQEGNDMKALLHKLVKLFRREFLYRLLLIGSAWIIYFYINIEAMPPYSMQFYIMVII